MMQSKTIASEINGRRYYLDAGFHSMTAISALLSDESIFQGEECISPGMLCVKTLMIAGKAHHPDINWPEFIESLPTESYIEVWDAVSSLVETISGSTNKE